MQVDVAGLVPPEECAQKVHRGTPTPVLDMCVGKLSLTSGVMAERRQSKKMYLILEFTTSAVLASRVQSFTVGGTRAALLLTTHTQSMHDL